MVYRVFVEKKAGLNPEAAALLSDCIAFLGLKNLEKIRILNRYDVEGIDEKLFCNAKSTVFSEPQIDIIYDSPDLSDADVVFAVEPLPGQFDQRADSAAQCIQIQSQGERPTVQSAKVYALYGKLSEADISTIKGYVINAVESREASLEKPDTLSAKAEAPCDIPTLCGFTELDEAELAELIDTLGLAMDIEDLRFLQSYFCNDERRNPTITEIKVVDTYWSDHCRHTTFCTHIDSADIADPRVKSAYERYLKIRAEVYGEAVAKNRPQTLMDIATIGTKALKKRGLTPELDESEEINACSIHVSAKVDDTEQDWLLMFKNETHNHPTEIEPFGGAATCIGGCIRDPLSGRAYVHQAMRVTGGGDPRKALFETLSGKLPQRKLATTAAAGYSSYGNQIGLATGLVAEVYHDGYIAKRLECGAVVAAAPASNVRRERPVAGDVVILLGGRTGRDGIGGATGSSKSHNAKSLSTMASEVQKGNATEERKIQRLFRNSEVTQLIKRCNDFGAGGVSVAIGELADGLKINLDAIRKKYDGLDGTELAISESQERMAVVVSPCDVDRFISLAHSENLEAYPVAAVTDDNRMTMEWNGKPIASISREFLNTNGAVKHTSVSVDNKDLSSLIRPIYTSLREMAEDIKTASRRGLIERFDSSIGAGTVLAPFGGKTQRTPTQAMVALLPVLPHQSTEQASAMSYGLDPDCMSIDPYTGAHSAVYTSVAKLVATGADYKRAYLSLQEFFEKLKDEPLRWGKPFSALLGAMDAQLELGIAAIGGKDSMSGSFLDLDVPPTLISFAVAPIDTDEVLSPEFKSARSSVYLFGSMENTADIKKSWDIFYKLHKKGIVKSAWAVENGIAEGIMKMSFGNRIGFRSEAGFDRWHSYGFGCIVAELSEDIACPNTIKLGTTTTEPNIALGNDTATIDELLTLNEAVLDEVYPTSAPSTKDILPVFTYNSVQTMSPSIRTSCPKVIIPVFPGTNCEYDTARALIGAGADAEILVLRNLSADDVAKSVDELAKSLKSANMVVIPGGFSGGDEPDGSAKLITSFFRNPAIKEQITDLLENRDGLMLGICNGFQALIKLGLVPYGKIIDTDDTCPTLTYNTIGRHQSKLVHTRVCSNKSPWLSGVEVGEIYTVPISHGEGRFLASDELIAQLSANGQIATQYVDTAGIPSMSTEFNPNGSICAIEGITSPDGRVLGKMGHSERIGKHLYKNVVGRYDIQLFDSAVKYFR